MKSVNVKLHGTIFFSLCPIPRYVHHRSERKESFSEVHSAPLDTILCLSTCCKRELVLLQSCARKEGLQERALGMRLRLFWPLCPLPAASFIPERYKNASFLIFVRPLRVFSLARNTCLSLLFDQPFLSRNSFSLYFHFTRRICKSFAIKLVSFSLSLSIINVSLDYLQPCQHYTVYLNWIQKRLSIYAYRFPHTYLHFFSRRECKILSFKYISMLTARVAIETKIKISTVSLMLASLSL